MSPSEVDMALYMFDKLEGKKERLIEAKGLGKQEKIDKIMEIIEEILDGAITVSNREEVIKAGWSGRIRGSAQKLEREMRKLAQRGDLTGMFKFYSNPLRSFRGKRIGAWLEKYNKKSLESEYEKVKKIYSNSND